MQSKHEQFDYCCSEDGHGLKYPGFSAVFIQTFSIDDALRFSLPQSAVLPQDEYDAVMKKIAKKADETKVFDSLAEFMDRPAVLMKQTIEKQIFVMQESSEIIPSKDANYVDFDSRNVYRFSLKGFDFEMPLKPNEEQDFDSVVLSGHAFVEMSLFFGHTVSITYRFCFNGYAAKLSEPVVTDHIIALLSTYLGAEFWSYDPVKPNHQSTPADQGPEESDDQESEADINLITEFYVYNLWYSDEGKYLQTPREKIDLTGKGRTFDTICNIYKQFIYNSCTIFKPDLTKQEMVKYLTWRKSNPVNVTSDNHYAMLDIWENIMHPAYDEDGNERDIFAKNAPEEFSEAEIINHLRDFHKPELIGLMSLYQCEWPYRDPEAYDDVCGRNIAIDTDDLVLVGNCMAVVIGTYERRGTEVIEGKKEGKTDGKMQKQGVVWADHVKERAKYHVSWAEYLMILQMVLAKKHIIGIAKDQLIEVAMTANNKSSEELIGQNAEVGIRLSRMILQLDVVKYSKFTSHVVMFDRTTERLNLEKDMEQFNNISGMVDSSLHNLSDYKAMKSDFLLNVILAFISCASTFELLFQNSEMPFLSYFNISSSGFAAWLVTIVACVTLFAILLVAKGFIKKLYESLKNRNLRKEYETYRDNFRKQR